MSIKNTRLLDKAKAALEDLFSDCSVSRDKCRENLGELKDEIQQKLDCLDADDARDAE